MNTLLLIFFALDSLLLLIILVIAVMIMRRQKAEARDREKALENSNEFQREQKENISAIRQDDAAIIENIGKNAESLNAALSDISRQKLLIQELPKAVGEMVPHGISERVDGCCAQITNRLFALEEKIGDLKRIHARMLDDLANRRSASAASAPEELPQTVPAPPRTRNLIAELIASMAPGNNASPAQKKKFEMQAEIVRMVDEILKISVMTPSPDFSLTPDTDWVKELGFNYEQVAQVDIMLLARLFKLDAEDIINHLSDSGFFPKEYEGKSIFWRAAWRRGDDFDRDYAREPGAIVSEPISSFGRDFWKKVSFNGETKEPDYITCFQRVFYYCEQKDYFNRVIRSL